NAGRYRLRIDGQRVGFDLVADDCVPRRMILDRSTWRPAGEIDPPPARSITRTAAPRVAPLPSASMAAGSWPSFRGPQASGVADGQRLPDKWDGKTGENIRWRTAIPGLAHSTPIG